MKETNKDEEPALSMEEKTAKQKDKTELKIYTNWLLGQNDQYYFNMLMTC